MAGGAVESKMHVPDCRAGTSFVGKTTWFGRFFCVPGINVYFMRILALDYGSVTVGTAMSDELGLTAQPLETITRSKENHLRQTLAAIVSLVVEYKVGLIVLGKPVHMDGSEGDRVEKARGFKAQLEGRLQRLAAESGSSSVPVVWHDERLTTVEADEILTQSGIPKTDRKRYIDSVAASVILRDYMNQNERNST